MASKSEDNVPLVKYVLTAQVNGLKVFEGSYPDTFEIQEEGLEQAESAVEQALGLTKTDLELEEVSFLKKKGIYGHWV